MPANNAAQAASALTLTDLAAFGGFALALVSLSWQIFSWRLEAGRPRLEVFQRQDRTDPKAPSDVIHLVVRNRGRMPLTVEGWGFEVDKKHQAQFSDPEVETPARVEPHESEVFELRSQWLAKTLLEADFNPTQKVRPWVQLGTGKTRTGKKFSLTEYVNRVHFVVSSKHGHGILSISHPSANQSLTIPMYPNSAVEAVAPLLEPAFGHYALEAARVLDLPDPEERDALSFFLPASALPKRIVDPDRADELVEAALPFYDPEDLAWFEGEKPKVLFTADRPTSRIYGNIDEFSVHANQMRVQLFEG